MELEWSDYQSAPYQEWVTTGTSQQVVGMIPATNTTAATPVFQQSSSGYYQGRTRVYECKVLMRMKDSVIVDSTVDGNVCRNSSPRCVNGPVKMKRRIMS
ncbi:hypothetical protein WJ972_07540 [Achromobacter insuavis]